MTAWMRLTPLCLSEQARHGADVRCIRQVVLRLYQTGQTRYQPDALVPVTLTPSCLSHKAVSRFHTRRHTSTSTVSRFSPPSDVPSAWASTAQAQAPSRPSATEPHHVPLATCAPCPYSAQRPRVFCGPCQRPSPAARGPRPDRVRRCRCRCRCRRGRAGDAGRGRGRGRSGARARPRSQPSRAPAASGTHTHTHTHTQTHTHTHTHTHTQPHTRLGCGLLCRAALRRATHTLTHTHRWSAGLLSAHSWSLLGAALYPAHTHSRRGLVSSTHTQQARPCIPHTHTAGAALYPAHTHSRRGLVSSTHTQQARPCIPHTHTAGAALYPAHTHSRRGLVSSTHTQQARPCIPHTHTAGAALHPAGAAWYQTIGVCLVSGEARGVARAVRCVALYLGCCGALYLACCGALLPCPAAVPVFWRSTCPGGAQPALVYSPARAGPRWSVASEYRIRIGPTRWSALVCSQRI
jgi:hypothetical protein